MSDVNGILSESSVSNTNVEDLPDEDAEQIRLSRRIQESLEPYRKTFISVSATLRFPPPHPIRRMKELDDELMRVKREWEDEVIRREEKSHAHHQQEVTVTQASISAPSPDPDDIAAQIESLPLPDIPSTPVIGNNDATPAEGPGFFDYMSTSSGTIAASPMPCTPSDEPPVEKTTVEDIVLESRLSYMKWQHAEQRRIWEWYLRKNRDDFDVEKYQCISLWEATLPMTEPGLHRACSPPQLKYITFYGENDCTLGQFIDKAVMDTLVRFLDPKAICENKSCNQPLARHCKVYVHNETRLVVAVEQWDGHINRANYLSNAPDTIITWSACRVCGSATPFIPISPEMQRYSFAKFLELHFYPADVQLVQGAGCLHNIYQHHVRYFAIRGMTVRFQADPVILHEIVYPSMRIRVRPEMQLEIRNTDFDRLHRRNETWYTALIDDLKLINIDAATGDEESDARLTAEINQLIVKAEWEKQDIAKLINTIYKETPSTDTLALNQVRAYRQDRIVAWQQDFDKLPKPRVTQLFDRSSRRTSAFDSVRAIFPRRSDYYGSLDAQQGMSEPEDNGPLLMRRVTGDSFTSTASDVSETESVTDNSEEKISAPDVVSSPTEVTLLPPSIVDIAAAKSDEESDSTIGAIRRESVTNAILSSEGEPGTERTSHHVSRLPRRASNHPTVAELVKKYQDFLPAQGVEELTKTAFAPTAPVDESEQEMPSEMPPRVRSKSRRRVVNRKSSISDFESGYAANVAPRYLTHRRPLGVTPYNSRIPGPTVSSFDSRDISRRASPDKRPTTTVANSDVTLKAGRPSPPLTRSNSVAVGAKKKGKATARNLPAEKITGPRPTSSSGPKSTLRRQPGGGGKVSNIAKHFERITKDNERANRRYAVIRGRRPRPVASARAKVEVLDSIKDAIRDETESSDSSEADDEGDGDEETEPQVEKKRLEASAPAQAPSEPEESAASAEAPLEPPTESQGAELPVAETTLEPEITVQEASLSVSNSPILTAMTHEPAPLASPAPEFEGGATGTERHSILKALSGFWPQTSQPRQRADLDGDDPMADPEHIFRNSSMVVRTDEPTSIIALALNSPQYRELLLASRAEKRQSKEPKLSDGGEVFMPDDRSIAESTSTWGVVNVESSGGVDPTEELRVPSSKQPWAICKCVKWDASGGKSGSAFLKTLDDRFIAKELSRAELQAMETFAPAYFDYMSSAVIANRPTLLAKIFGCFKITFRKTQKQQGSGRSKPTQMNLLVMENLFYDRRFSKIYDLKGSTRNRHVQSTGRENEVLLDENLVETAHLTPFYLREHSKRILRGALFNDSKFLADINVMDYSLVVGVDSVKNELVVGIVGQSSTSCVQSKMSSLSPRRLHSDIYLG
ncbi:hypothetical protein IEO21_03224 [Rhodonia placenta]|uniref:PIPK domain-containing protein n=1 Tax=Rhodonia placenta TaxID=104341 RepID=A0A8H7U4F2_9APHY|nr:hypothetical protein IEO21_03224 [Postia placenta]